MMAGSDHKHAPHQHQSHPHRQPPHCQPPLPRLVSLLTPTFNRRAFIPSLVRSVLAQSYVGPMEWVVVDDGTDCVRDLFEAVTGELAARDVELRYETTPRRMPIGRKRNLLSTLARGEVCIFIDDDDYHPPQRVQHSVDTLAAHPEVDVAGCSRLLVLEVPEMRLHWIGPFGENHASCGTLAVRRKLLLARRFGDRTRAAEEGELLDNFTLPVAQLRPEATLVCVAHSRNTVDKRAVVEQCGEQRHVPELEEIMPSETIAFYAAMK